MKRKAREKIVLVEASPLAVASPALGTPALGYARVEAALARVYDAEGVQKNAFRGRLKHFRKLGIPHHNPGKGGRIAYDVQDVWQLMVCLELSEFGIDPNLIVKIVQRHWAGRGYFKKAIQNVQLFPKENFLAVIQTDFMSWTWNREKFKQNDAGIFLSSGMLDPVWVAFPKESDAAVIFKELRKEGRRACVFNLSSRILAVQKALEESVP
jgi:hypothetical protein